MEDESDYKAHGITYLSPDSQKMCGDILQEGNSYVDIKLQNTYLTKKEKEQQFEINAKNKILNEIKAKHKPELLRKGKNEARVCANTEAIILDSPCYQIHYLNEYQILFNNQTRQDDCTSKLLLMLPIVPRD